MAHYLFQASHAFALPMEKAFLGGEYAAFAATHLYIPFVTVSLYLAFCVLGKRYMSTREAFDLQTPLLCWNALLCAFSFLGMCRTVLHCTYCTTALCCTYPYPLSYTCTYPRLSLVIHPAYTSGHSLSLPLALFSLTVLPHGINAHFLQFFSPYFINRINILCRFRLRWQCCGHSRSNPPCATLLSTELSAVGATDPQVGHSDIDTNTDTAH